MAERTPLFIHSDGYAESFDPTLDHMSMTGLVIGGASYAAGNVVLNTGKVQGLDDASADGEALSYNQSGATLSGLTVDVDDLSLTNGATVTGLPATPSGATEAVSKAYVDNIASNIKHKGHVACLKMMDDSLVTAPSLSSGDSGNAYVVAGTGGAWSSFSVGDIVEWDGSSWNLLVAQVSSEPPDGVRVIITDSSASGSFSGHEEEVGTYDEASNNWLLQTPDAAETRTVQADDGDSVYEHLAYQWDEENGEWILFNGAGQVNAGLGLTKDGNTLNVGNGDGIAVSADSIAVDLNTTGGLELIGTTPNKTLGIKIASSSELSADANGLNVEGVPALFQLGGVAVNSTVDAAALNTLTGGGNADSEHIHAHASMTGQTENDHHNRLHTLTSALDHQVSGETVGNILTITGTGNTFGWETPPDSDVSKRIEDSVVGVENITIGDPVYWETTTADQFGKGDATNRNKAYVFGVAAETKTAGNVCKIVSHGKAVGVLSGATTGDFYFLQSGGGINTTPPVGRKWLVAIGRAINSTDLWVQIEVVGRKPL